MNTQIKEDYVSFETAKLLKEKGFEELTYGFYYDNYTEKLIVSSPSNHNGSINSIAAPSQAQVMKWLREVHNLDIIVPPQFDSSKWTYSAIIIKLSIPCTEIRLNDNKDKKEEACEAAIKYCLTNLI